MPLTYIDIEKRKTWRIGIFFLVLLLIYLIAIVAFALPFLPRAALVPQRFWVFAFIIALSIAGIHFWFSAYNAVADVIRGLGAQPPDPKDDVHRMLLNIMQEIHVVTGNKRTIQCVVIPSLSLNALAAADLRGNAVIGITEGLLSRLTRPQIEGVIAHEAHHILSEDCLETTVAASLFGILSSFLEKSSRTTCDRSFPQPALFLAWLLLGFANLLNLFISREREYRADSAAVRMTRNPVALAEALYLLLRSWRGAGFIGSGYEMLCIVNPQVTALDESEGFWADLLSTHPPIQKRIDILLNMAHMNITALEANRKATFTPKLPGPVYYALNPQQQWQGPFILTDLAEQPWLSALTWIRTDNNQTVDRAWKDPLVSALLEGRFEQNQMPSDFACPSCSLPLITELYEGTQIYQCRFCAGTLIETSKIPRILARTDRDRPCSGRIKALAQTTLNENQLKLARQRFSAPAVKTAIPLFQCPKCKNPMYRGFYSGAYLIDTDRCSSCGFTWFGKDELAMLQCLIETEYNK